MPLLAIPRYDLANGRGNRAAEARLEFMKTYKDAYYLPAIQTHINEGAAIISSAKKAVSEARKNYNRRMPYFFDTS